MITKHSIPWIGALGGAVAWLLLSVICYLIFPHDWIASHVFQSTVNAVAFSIAGAILGFIYSRNHELEIEANWREAGSLPQFLTVTKYDQLAPFAARMSGRDKNRRPNSMLQSVFYTLHQCFERSPALETLNTLYAVEQRQIANRYRKWFGLINAVAACGVIGTLVGIQRACDSIDDMDVVTASLRVAFDTSLVSIVLAAVLRYMLNLLQQYDTDVLIQAYRQIFDNLVQAIRAPKHLRSGEPDFAMKQDRFTAKSKTTNGKENGKR